MEGGVPTQLAQSIPELIASALKQAGTPIEAPSKLPPPLLEADSWSVRQKVRFLVLRHCRHGWFTSTDIRELYERTFDPTIALATISTYLSRMFKEGNLTRRGSMAQREYRVNVEELTDEIANILAARV